jgi:hypothetical protein
VSTQDTRDRTASRASAHAPIRPATIKAAAALAVLAALATLANAVIALTDGKSLLHSMATDAVNQLTGGQSSGLDLGSMIDDAVTQEYGTLQARAYVGIVLAIGYLALVRPVSRGARKLRVVATLLAAVALVMAGIDAKDQTPGLLHGFDVAEMVCAALMVVALWLPASSAYIKGRAPRD